MQKFARKYWITLLGVVVGTAGGYVYYYFWGCVNGCPIKSNAWKMMLYGAFMGGLLFNIVQDFLHKRKSGKDPQEQR